MKPIEKCIICGDVYGGELNSPPQNIGYMRLHSCSVCGHYSIFADAQSFPEYFWKRPNAFYRFAAMAHMISNSSTESETRHFSINLDWLTKKFDTLQLPSPSNQALNLIRVIGENISKTGNPLIQFPRITPMVGCISHEKLGQLVQELVQKGLIRSSSVQERENPYDGKKIWAPTIDLTLDGWERFEAEQKGQLAGKFGFLAMKFNDEVLENFVSDYLKPNVAKETGYELKDVRQFSQAGIIDNIMRAHIRDSAFVIVDLTHDNSGAYWEAGYAEGLGKPVIYICKKDKFDKSSTHFDVNHCTTVMWELGEEGQSVEQVIATIRRSLNLFQ